MSNDYGSEIHVENIHIILFNVEEPGIIQGPLRERETVLRFSESSSSFTIQTARDTHMHTCKYPLPSVSVSEKVWSSGSMQRAALSLSLALYADEVTPRTWHKDVP